MSTDTLDLIGQVKHLTKKEKLHILNILKQNNVGFTKNANGYFFNLAQIGPDVEVKLCKCLELIRKNRDVIKEMDTRREELLKYYTKLIEERLIKRIEEREAEYINMLIERPVSSISMQLKRKLRIQRLVPFDASCELDPDVLMAEASKKVKYPKDSVLFRLYTKIRSYRMSRKGTVYDREECIDYIGNDEDTYDGDPEIDADADADAEADVELGLDAVDDHGMTDSYHEGEGEVEEEVELEGEEEDEDAGEHEIEEDEESRVDDEVLTYYRNLLHKHGFTFDENSRCFLVYQEYIE